MLKDISKKKAVVVAFLLFAFGSLNAQTYDGSKGKSICMDKRPTELLMLRKWKLE